MSNGVTEQAWRNLVAGASIDDLKLSKVNGRVDLRGLEIDAPLVKDRHSTAIARIERLENLVALRGVRWRGLDFSDSKLPSLRIFDSSITDCKFDGAYCQDWRMWASAISQTSFQGADLRASALGGIIEARRNEFRNIDFSQADLRRTAYTSADFINCQFSRTKLNKVDFQGSRFVDCVFAGELNEVMFYRSAFRGESFPLNEMIRVDFSQAKLRWCEFRGLDLETVRFPEDDEHILVPDYRETLTRLVAFLELESDETSRRLGSTLSHLLKWAGPNQARGVINRNDLVKFGGREAVEILTDLMAKRRPDPRKLSSNIDCDNS